jgi:hypothetical protein
MRISLINLLADRSCFTRNARSGAKSRMVVGVWNLAARSSGVPFLDRRGLNGTILNAAAPAFASRSSGVPFFDRRCRRAASRRL